MSVLLLRLAGPLQSWADSSRFARRLTRPEPTKSGVLGLLAAAQGRRRSDPVEDLAALRFGVRVDQPGQMIRDFQTARSLDGKQTMPLSARYYLVDAVFLAAVEGDQALLEGIDAAVRYPTYPLYLGRRSCPPAGPLTLGVHRGNLLDVLTEAHWQASPWYRSRQGARVVLPIVHDSTDPAEALELVRDHPVSFDPVLRQHAWRPVTRTEHIVNNPDAYLRPEPDLTPAGPGDDHHEPFAAF